MAVEGFENWDRACLARGSVFGNRGNSNMNDIKAFDMGKFIEKAVRECISSGAVDDLLRERIIQTDDRPRCEKCAFWDRRTMHCMSWDHGGGTTQPFQLCVNFIRTFDKEDE